MKLFLVNCVFIDNGFLLVSKIYIECNKLDVDLKLYFIFLLKEYIVFKVLFEKFGCEKS